MSSLSTPPLFSISVCGNDLSFVGIILWLCQYITAKVGKSKRHESWQDVCWFWQTGDNAQMIFGNSNRNICVRYIYELWTCRLSASLGYKLKLEAIILSRFRAGFICPKKLDSISKVCVHINNSKLCPMVSIILIAYNKINLLEMANSSLRQDMSKAFPIRAVTFPLIPHNIIESRSWVQFHTYQTALYPKVHEHQFFSTAKTVEHRYQPLEW